MTTTAATPTTTARACAGPDCGEPVASTQATARYCSEKCRKRAAKARERASRPAPARERTPRTKRQAPDRQQAASDAAVFVANLERETAASLRKDPGRWRTTQAADPDHHRAKPTRASRRRAAP